MELWSFLDYPWDTRIIIICTLSIEVFSQTAKTINTFYLDQRHTTSTVRILLSQGQAKEEEYIKASLNHFQHDLIIAH